MSTTVPDQEPSTGMNNAHHAAPGDTELPSYQEIQAVMQAPSTQLNTETNGNFSTTHKSVLVEGNYEWLTLGITTKPRKPASLPVFEKGDFIKGEVEVDCSKKSVNKVKSVTVSVIGTVKQLNRDPLVFLEQTQALWTSDLTPFPATNQPRAGSGTMDIKYTWPFSFTLPERVEVEGSEYDTPPTVTLRSSPVSIDYELVVQIKRQGLFKLPIALKTVFGYRLGTCAEPPSALRQVSLRDGGTAFGPDIDPQGWKVLPSVSLKGYANGKPQPSEVEVALAVSQPATYPVGSPVPLLLTFKSNDSQALDLLATPRAIGLELLRTITTALQQGSVGKGNARKLYTEGEGFAVWWAADADPTTESATERKFHGELNVPSTIIPSFAFPRCYVLYTLRLLHPPPTTGWTALPTPSETPPPIISEVITIVAKHAPGIPRARPAAPPGYKDESAAQYKVLGKTFLASGFV